MANLKYLPKRAMLTLDGDDSQVWTWRMTGIEAYIAAADDLAAECCDHGTRDGYECSQCDQRTVGLEEYLWDAEDVEERWRDREHSRLMDEYGLMESDFH